MKVVTFLVLLVCVNTSYALTLDDVLSEIKGNTSLYYGYKSHHWFTVDYTNSTHHLVALRYKSLMFGRFDNSYDRETYFIGFQKDFFTYENLKVEGAFGIMRGYTSCFGDGDNTTNICPMAALSVSYSFGYDLKPILYQLGDATVDGVKYDF